MTFSTDLHVLVGDETLVEVMPAEARVLLGEGSWKRLALTLTDVPSVDRLMVALADVRDALNRPAGTATPRRHAITAGGGEW